MNVFHRTFGRVLRKGPEIASPELSTEEERLVFAAGKELFLDLWGHELTASERVALQRADTEEELNAVLESVPDDMVKRVEVNVQETLIGDLPDRLVLSTGMEGADCGVDFRDGETYLIEAQLVRDLLWSTSICSRTNRIRDAQEDLEALRSWKKGESLTPRVYGYVDDWTSRHDEHPSSYPRIGGVRLKLLGESETHEAVTDSEGRFRFEGLESQVYRLELDEPDWHFWSTAQARSTIDLTEAHCAELHIALEEH